MMRFRVARPRPEHGQEPARPRRGLASALGGIAFAVAVLALLFVYYRTMFPGLTNPDAIDFAQLGRNVSAGRGFTSYVLRPLALNYGGNPVGQPDVTHGPLFPLLLAIAFSTVGVRDGVAAAVSALFFLMTIPLVYLLGRRVFDWRVGAVTAGLFAFNALMLEYAVSGLHITLYTFLTTCLLLVVYHLATHARDRGGEWTLGLPRLWLVLAGLLTAALYLTDPIFILIMPVVFVAALWLNGGRRTAAALHFLVPFALLAAPWMVRNGLLTGNPVFGLRGMELWMHTPAYYPGHSAYRLDPDQLSIGGKTLQAVLNKMVAAGGQVLEVMPQVTASWILAFFLPALLFRFPDPAANTLRRVMMFSYLGILCSAALFVVQMPHFVALIPTMLAFAVAFLLALIRQAQMSRGSVAAVGALLVVAAAYPLLMDMRMTSKPRPVREQVNARALGARTRPDEVVFSDQPWLVAWYADRPAIWLPLSEARVPDFRRQFGTARWLFLTEGARRASPQWELLYNQLFQWNLEYARLSVQERAKVGAVPLPGKGIPLLENLKGFAWLPPAKDAVLTAVVAAAPPNGEKPARLGLGNGRENRLAQWHR